MSKQRRYKRRKDMMRRRQILKISGAVFLVVIAITLFFAYGNRSDNVASGEEVRGVWISYGDFGNLGLYNQSEENFRRNAEAFLDTAEEMRINTVYFHVRAFRDAAYDSEYFPMASYVWDRAESIDYDPLKIMIELTHEHDMQLHAWLNPYRNSSFEEEILDPAEESSTEEILLCVGEIVDNYDVDGIHFDDYFYEEGSQLSDEKKMTNVNKMVQQVYSRVHDAGRNLVFGISPAGNISYCESIGADVKTWMSQDGYVDYIIPQIYWTDHHSATWREKMYSDTLDEWCTLNTNKTPLYIGLAAYKAGTDDAEDPGWKFSNDNLVFQIEKLREKECDGYVLFSGSDFYRDTAEEEFNNYRNLVF